MSDVPIITNKYISKLEDPIHNSLEINDVIFNEGNMYYSNKLKCSNSQNDNTEITTRVMVDNNKPLSKGEESIYNKVMNNFSETPTYKMGGTVSEIEYLVKKTILDKRDDDDDDDDDDIDTMIENIKKDISKKKNTIRTLITNTQIYLSMSGQEYLNDNDNNNDIIKSINDKLGNFKNVSNIWKYE